MNLTELRTYVSTGSKKPSDELERVLSFSIEELKRAIRDGQVILPDDVKFWNGQLNVEYTSAPTDYAEEYEERDDKMRHGWSCKFFGDSERTGKYSLNLRIFLDRTGDLLAETTRYENGPFGSSPRGTEVRPYYPQQGFVLNLEDDGVFAVYRPTSSLLLGLQRVLRSVAKPVEEKRE